MDQFVCVRIVQANTLDLSLFQFDFDLTFAAFFMNADRTLYGRFGSRSDKDGSDDISLAGFREALLAALELHRGYPGNRESLRGKQATTGRYKTPDDYPSLRGKYKADLDYAGSVARSCMHCHQVREAEREVYRAARQPIPDNVLFPYPMPDVLGLSFDPKAKAKLTRVAAGSPAARDGFRAGDELVTLQGQPLLSVADVQWALHTAAEPSKLTAQVLRAGQPMSLTLSLDRGWRRGSDLAWRPTTWDLRRMGTGGLVLEDLAPDERRRAGLTATALALRVKHVGQFGGHAAAKRAGFQKDDILVAFDGRRTRMSETDLLAQVLQTKRPGEQVPVTVLRGNRRLDLKLPTQ